MNEDAFVKGLHFPLTLFCYFYYQLCNMMCQHCVCFRLFSMVKEICGHFKRLKKYEAESSSTMIFLDRRELTKAPTTVICKCTSIICTKRILTSLKVLWMRMPLLSVFCCFRSKILRIRIFSSVVWYLWYVLDKIDYV